MPKRSFRGFALALAAMLVVAPLTDSSARAGVRAQSTSSALQATTTTAPPSAYAQLRPAPGDGKLHVVLAAPQGKLKDIGNTTELRWMFDRPMVDLSAIADRADPAGFVTFEPELPGTFRWASTRMLVFTPSNDLSASTGYRVTLHDLASLDGSMLARPFVLVFETPTVRCGFVQTSDRWERGGTPPTFAVSCDQPVDWSDVASHTALQFRSLVLNLKAFTPTPGDLAKMKAADATGAGRLAAAIARLGDTKRPLGTSEVIYTGDAPCNDLPDSPICHWMAAKRALAPDATAELKFAAGITSFAGPLKSEAHGDTRINTPGTLLIVPATCRSICDPEANVGLTSSGGSFEPAELRGKLHVVDAKGATQTYDPPPYDADHALPDRYTDPLSLRWAMLRPGRRYEVRIDPTAVSTNGQKLGYTSITTFSLGHFPAYAWIGTGEQVMEFSKAAGPRVYARNVTEIEVVGDRIDPKRLVEVVRAYGTDDPKKRLDPSTFKTTSRAIARKVDNERRTRIDLTKLPKAKKGGVYLIAVRPTKWEPASLYDEQGFPVKVPVSPPKAKVSDWATTLVQRTDLGVTLKQSPVNVLVSVTALETGKPVKGAKVELYAAGKDPYWKGKTDAAGFAWAPANPERNCDRCNVIAVVGHDGDSAYAQSRWREDYDDTYYDELARDPGDGSGGDEVSGDADRPLVVLPPGERIIGSMFADRGVYKLGENVHVKGVLRRQTPEKLEFLADTVTKVKVRVRDGRGSPVATKTVALSKTGAFDTSFKLPADGTQGSYSVEAVGADTSTSVLVASFRRPEFAVDVASKKPSYVAGDTFEGTIDGRYLFGAPMSDRDSAWTLTASPTYFDPTAKLDPVVTRKRSLDGFSWRFVCLGSSDCPSTDNVDLAKGEGRLDPVGRLTVSTPLARNTKRQSPLSLDLESTVTDVNRQAIANRTFATLHPAEVYAGIRLPEEFGAAGEPLKVEAITLSPDAKAVAGTALTARLIRWDWVVAKRRDGNEQTSSVGQYVPTEVAKTNVTTAAAPVSFTLTPNRSGLYEVNVTGTDSRGNWIEAGTEAYVTGSGRVAWRNPEDDSVTLIPEKSNYAVGETARILIQSPWPTAEGMLTVERGKVITASRFQIRNSATAIEVPIKADNTPNLYVSIAVFKGRTAPPSAKDPDDPGRPQVRSGTVELTVPPTEKTLAVTVKADKAEYRPGVDATATVHVADAAGKGVGKSEVTLWAVDEGVLRLTNYATPDLLDDMYPSRGLDVSTADTRMRVRALTPDEAKGGPQESPEPGGGGGEGGSEVEGLRTDFRVLAVWKGTVTTDDNGDASATFKLPQSLSAYRILAVAVEGADRYGAAKSELRIAKPFLVRPALPRFMTIGDTAEVGAVLQNETGKPGTGTLSIVLPEGSPVSIDGPATKTVRLTGGPLEVRFTLKATKAGLLRTTMKGSFIADGAAAPAAPETDAVVGSFPVSVTRRLETVATGGVASAGSPQTERLSMPANIYPDLGGLELSTSSSALSGLQTGVDSLVEYPYGCLEQRSSRTRVLLMLKDLRGAFPLPGLGKAPLATVVAQELIRVREYLTPDGGLSYWPGSEFSDVFLTARVLVLLLDAADQGVKIPEDVKESVIGYLQSLVSNAKEGGLFDDGTAIDPAADTSGVSSNISQVLYALARSGKPEKALNEVLYKKRFQLSLLDQQYLLRAMLESGDSGSKPAQLWKEIRNYIRIEADQAFVQDDASYESGCQCLAYLYADDTHNTSELLSIMVKIDPNDELAPKMARWLLAQRVNGTWQNTLESGWALTALVDYYKAAEPDSPDFQATVTLGAAKVLDQRFAGRDLTARTSSTPTAQLGSLAGGTPTPLTFSATGVGKLYYSARLRYAPNLATLKPLDAGFTVERTYLSYADGKALTSVKAGELVRVQLRISTPQRRQNVAIDDPLPAGLESVNAQLASSSQSELSTTDSSSAFAAGINHTQLRDERTLLFATTLDPGTFVYEYLARATSPGSYVIAPVQAEEMYRPEIFGRSGTGSLAIVGG